METNSIINNLEVVFLTAPKFPEDVPATFEKLNALLPNNPNRRFFGISHPDRTGTIVYKAAAELLPTDNALPAALGKFSILKGNFVSKYIVNHFEDSNNIGRAFQDLLKHPQIDPKGYCLEVYKNYSDKDVHCMVRIIP